MCGYSTILGCSNINGCSDFSYSQLFVNLRLCE
nr:MAG TPA: hypothetical protein [Bacteriophage sp.]